MSALIALSSHCSPKTPAPQRRPTRQAVNNPLDSANWDRTSFSDSHSPSNDSIFDAYSSPSHPTFTNPWSKDANGRNPPLLPRTDHGLWAYLVLFSAFTLSFFLSSLPSAFGVFQAYYLSSPPNQPTDFASPNLIFIGVLSSSLPDLGAPLMTYLVERFPRHRILMLWLGYPLVLASLLSASYAPSLPLLILTQGLLYGFGSLILYFPLLSLLNEWWDSRLGFAYGILDCASPLAGIPMPFLTSWLLTTYGSPITLRIFTVAIAIGMFPALCLTRGRIPKAHLSSHPPAQSYAFFRNPLFALYLSTTFLYALGWYSPASWLPTFIADLEFDLFPLATTADGTKSKPLQLDLENTSAFILALMSAACIPSALIMGHLSDKSHHLSLPLLGALSTATCAFAILVFWGFAQTLWWLIPFAIIFSGWGGGWEVLWARMSVAVRMDSNTNSYNKNESDTTTSTGKNKAGILNGDNSKLKTLKLKEKLATKDKNDKTPKRSHLKQDNLPAYSILSFARGTGNLIAGLCGSRLISVGPSGDAVIPHEFGAGKYMPLILFCGAALFVAALGLFIWWCLPGSVTRRWDAGERKELEELEEVVFVVGIKEEGDEGEASGSARDKGGKGDEGEKGVRERKKTGGMEGMLGIDVEACEGEREKEVERGRVASVLS